MFVVAGVSGHVGSVVAGELLAKGQPVKVLVRDAAKGRSWSSQGAEVAVASIEDEAALTIALRGAHGFFVLLPPNWGGGDLYGWQRATVKIVADAVKAAGVKHVVLLSSVGADVAENNGPIKGLFHFENALRETGAVVTAIRAGFFQENIGNNIKPAKEAGIYPNFSPSADYPMPMIATKDIGLLAAEELMKKPTESEIIDLHGPAYTINQVAQKLGAALGKSLTVVNIPQEAWVTTLAQAGLPQVWADAYAEMYAGFASGKLGPKAKRFVQGKVEIDDTIKHLTST